MVLFDFVKLNELVFRVYIFEGVDFCVWVCDIFDWFYSIVYIIVGYGLKYDGVDIE